MNGLRRKFSSFAPLSRDYKMLSKMLTFAAVFFLSALVYSGISPATAVAELTPAETARLESCEAAIAELNPIIAADCLNETWILSKLAEQDPDRALKFIQEANTLKDLLDLLNMHTGASELRTALAIRLEPGGPAVKLGLGPESDKFLNWVRKYKPEKFALVQKAMRTWDALGKDEKAWLKTGGYNTNSWNRLSLGDRNRVLSQFARDEARKLLAIHKVTSRTALSKMRSRFYALYYDLDDVTKSKVSRHITQLETMLAIREQTPEKLAKNQEELQNFQTELENIKDLPVSEQLGRLNEFFDNTPALKDSSLATTLDSQRESAPNEKFTDKDRQTASALLQTAMLKEITGTRTGDRLTGFFRKKENTLSLKIAPTPAAYALFNPSTGDIIFSEDTVQEWMRTNGYTTKDLMTKKEPIERLARFLSPFFVHEATHQQQNAWIKSKHLMDPYPHDDEVEAMSVEALYVIEKMKKDPAFVKMFSSGGMFSSYLRAEAIKGKRFLEDPREFRRVIRSAYYPDRPSFEAAASMFTASSEVITRELNRRQSLSEKEQARLEKEGLANTKGLSLEAGVPKLKTSVLKVLRNYYLYWYAEFRKRITQEISWADSTLAAIMADKPGNAGYIVPPPTK